MSITLTIYSTLPRLAINPIQPLQPKCKCTNGICDNLLENKETELKKAKEQIRMLEEALQISDVSHQPSLCTQDLACEDFLASVQNSCHDLNG